MKIGFSGLGRMGGNMVARLLKDGHEVIVMNRSPEPAQKAAALGAKVASTPEELIDSLEPVIIWIMLPDTIVADHLKAMLPIAPQGSIFIDGGNSDFRNTKKLAEVVKAAGSSLVDVGTS